VKKYWPVITLLALELIIACTNITPNTILAGWDNLFPEFNFPLNFWRSIFGVWIQYRGTGLYDGMSHAANLVHTLTIWLMSIVIPHNLLRYSFHLGMHVVGGIGTYMLLTKLFRNKIISLTGAFFYMLNLATIQMFYAPLEAFSVHFASLPWLSWALVTFYERGSRKSYIVYLFVILLSTPQYFVTTFLLPTGILISCLSLRQKFSRVLPAVAGFLLVNLFWLLPYLWGLPHNGSIISAAKINQMSSSEIFARNQAFGNLGDVLTLRGFTLDYADLNPNNTSIMMMEPWRNFINTPLAQVVTGLFVVVAFIGLISLLAKPAWPAIPFLLTFVAGFVLLGNDIPGIREITVWLQNTIPLFREAFRFTFTKFSLLFGLSYAVLFCAGLLAMFRSRLAALSVFAIAGIVFVAYPAFQGNFFYKNLRITIPEEYVQAFEYANTLDKNSRMIVLPQHEYWSWKYYRFGYRGSGFSWFGLPQPIMDRAFDPWSATNENYYWELSRALYAKDAAGIDAVMAKYDIRYILLDENVTTPNNNRSLFIDEIKNLLGTPARTFGKLSLYERAPRADSFISLKQNLPTVNPYTWTDNDVAYRELGDYITGEGGITYQFRSLFTKRSVNERDFDALALLTAAKPVYDSTASADLTAAAVKECGLLKEGAASASEADGALQLRSINQRGCLSFDIPTLSHKFGYLAAVESRHVTGRPLMISFINDTARHVELETYLDGTTDYFILPPLAPDGLGYTVYLSNDAIGKQETVNTVSRIRLYQIPYNDLVNIRTGTQIPASAGMTIQVSHPNPAFYNVTMRQRVDASTLILSQSYDPGWIALSDGKILPHVKVNNWKNGWTIDPGTSGAIYIFFWPQLLQFLGFALLPIPFILVFTRKK